MFVFNVFELRRPVWVDNTVPRRHVLVNKTLNVSHEILCKVLVRETQDLLKTRQATAIALYSTVLL